MFLAPVLAYCSVNSFWGFFSMASAMSFGRGTFSTTGWSLPWSLFTIIRIFGHGWILDEFGTFSLDRYLEWKFIKKLFHEPPYNTMTVCGIFFSRFAYLQQFWVLFLCFGYLDRRGFRFIKFVYSRVPNKWTGRLLENGKKSHLYALIWNYTFINF